MHLRLPLVLAATCLGTGAALLAGRAVLARRPALTPALPTAALARTLRWSPDPERRREAALLLLARRGRDQDPNGRRRLLRGQGWGKDPLAALVLKQDALAAASLGRRARSEQLWRELLRRFPAAPAAADALYYLGREEPPLRRRLLRGFPSHPAALAAALELGPAPADRLEGAFHLARWGERWPGARARFTALCADPPAGLPPQRRALLATALARLGDGPAALACLEGQPAALAALDGAGRLALGRTLLAAGPDRLPRAEALLLDLVRRDPNGPEAEEAVRLLARRPGSAAVAVLERLPPPWRSSTPVLARRILARSAEAPDRGSLDAALALLRRRPDDPASWELLWDLARSSALAGRWAEADRLLQAIDPARLPPPLAARQRFWQGLAQRRLGRPGQATATWRGLRRSMPGGYYGWRAAVRLGEGDLRLGDGGGVPADGWTPLASGSAELDRLWRLNQSTEAWETWRFRRGGRAPQESAGLLVEGRLRQAVGDDWTGFAQLEQAELQLPPDQCPLLPRLERSLHPVRFPAAFGAAARDHDLAAALLLGLSKQESRFTPSVRSAAGAVGLMQLLPSTASELAGRRVAPEDLEEPGLNVELGAAYLAGLLRRWPRQPLLAVAAYNAGPGAAAGWRDARLAAEPELWVEAIPYPETRLYVKKVLGNAWSYQQPALPRCGPPPQPTP